MRSAILLFTFIFLLSSCTKEKEAAVDIPKQESVSIQSGQIILGGKYIGYIQGIEQSGIGPKSGGRIMSLNVQEGDRVKKGQILAKLSSQEGMISYNGLGNVIENMDSVKRSADTTRSNMVASRKTIISLYDTQIEQADIGIKNLEISIEQAKKNLGNQAGTLNGDYHLQASGFKKLADSVLYQGDKILGITTNFEYANDAWEPYLGARIGNIKSESEDAWNKLYAVRGEIMAKDSIVITPDNAQSETQHLADAYSTLNSLINTMSKMIENSVVGGGLPQEMLDGWISTWYTFKANEQASEAQFTLWKNGANTLINTSGSGGNSVASMNIDSLLTQLESMKKNIDVLKAEKESKLRELNININQIDGQKSQLDVQISQTAMNQSLAGESVDGTVILAPFDGVIVAKTASLGQVIDVGTPVFSIAKDDTVKIMVYLGQTEASSVHSGDMVHVQTENGTILSGSIFSVQPIADIATKKIPVEIHFNNSRHTFTVGSYVSVQFGGKTITGLSVPYRFINYSNGESVLNISGSGGMITKVPVGIVACSDLECIVEGNIQSGQSVLRP